MADERDFTETCEYLADEMELKDKERDKFITECHVRAGYEVVPTFVKEGKEARQQRKPRNGNGDEGGKVKRDWFGGAA